MAPMVIVVTIRKQLERVERARLCWGEHFFSYIDCALCIVQVQV